MTKTRKLPGALPPDPYQAQVGPTKGLLVRGTWELQWRPLEFSKICTCHNLCFKIYTHTHTKKKKKKSTIRQAVTDLTFRTCDLGPNPKPAFLRRTEFGWYFQLSWISCCYGLDTMKWVFRMHGQCAFITGKNGKVKVERVAIATQFVSASSIRRNDDQLWIWPFIVVRFEFHSLNDSRHCIIDCQLIMFLSQSDSWWHHDICASS